MLVKICKKKTSLFFVADQYCYVCDKDDNTYLLLICDKCNTHVCHTYCLDPPSDVIPDGEWVCFYCKNDQNYNNDIYNDNNIDNDNINDSFIDDGPVIINQNIDELFSEEEKTETRKKKKNNRKKKKNNFNNKYKDENEDYFYTIEDIESLQYSEKKSRRARNNDKNNLNVYPLQEYLKNSKKKEKNDFDIFELDDFNFEKKSALDAPNKKRKNKFL